MKKKGTKYIRAVRLPEGIRWGTFDHLHERKWLAEGDVVYCSDQFPSDKAAAEAMRIAKKEMRCHSSGIGLYHETVVPALAERLETL